MHYRIDDPEEAISAVRDAGLFAEDAELEAKVCGEIGLYSGITACLVTDASGNGYLVYGDQDADDILHDGNGDPIAVSEAEIYRLSTMYNTVYNALIVKTALGCNVINYFKKRANAINPVWLFDDFYDGIKAIHRHIGFLVRRKGDRRCNMMIWDEKSRMINTKNYVFSTWADPSVFDSVSYRPTCREIENSCFVSMNTATTDSSANRKRIVWIDDVILDGTGASIKGAENVSKIHCIGFYTYAVSGSIGSNIIYFDEKSGKYAAVLDNYAQSISVFKRYPYKQKYDRESTVYIGMKEFFFFNVGDPIQKNPTIYDDAVMLLYKRHNDNQYFKDNDSSVAVYRRKSDKKFSMTCFSDGRVLDFVDGNGNPIWFDDIEADYDNHLIRGRVGEKTYVYDYDDRMPADRIVRPMKEANPILAINNPDRFIIHVTDDGKKYGVEDSSNGGIEYYDDFVIDSADNPTVVFGCVRGGKIVRKLTYIY